MPGDGGGVSGAVAFEAAVVLHAAATFALVGLIWFVQVVHYPLFARIGGERLTRYEQDHQRRTGLVVAPMMLAESISAVWIVWLIETDAGAGAADGRAAAWAGLVLLTTIWAWTFGVMVPIHRRLERPGLSGTEIDVTVMKLVRMNLARAIMWTARGWISLALIMDVTTMTAIH